MTICKAFVILALQITAYSAVEATDSFWHQKSAVSHRHTRQTGKQCDMGKLCVPRHLCKNGKIITDGATLIDDRKQLPCEFSNICCALPDPLKCGYQHGEAAAPSAGKSGENEAEFGEFPWMVAIMRMEWRGYKYIRGGSLLTPQVILTSGRLVNALPPNKLSVRAGVLDSSKENEYYETQNRGVQRKIVHEAFNNGNHQNDIALLFVEQPFELGPTVGTICLPPSGASFQNSLCYATGWGQETFMARKHASILKKVELGVVPHARCQEQLRKTRLSQFFILDPSFVCAGGELGKDMCTGDGGSPLVCTLDNTPDRFYQVGIVSWGLSCGRANVPGVYANVPYLREWIVGKLAQENINSDFFTAT